MDYKMKVAYSPDGLEVRYEDDGETVSEIIPQDVLQSLDLAIRIDEYISLTQTLEGAGDAALGQIDPTQASGEAIRAVKDQAAIPLNEQISAYKQLREDIAYMDYKMKVAYSPDGLEVRYEDNGETVSEVIPQEVLQSLDLAIRIDVSPIDPYSKLAQETALERLMTAGNITFEEYVNLLDTSSTVPKAKLEQVIKARVPEIPEETIGGVEDATNEMQFEEQGQMY